MQWIESETLELKKSTGELKVGIVSLVAMLNKHHRGELWFGIKNDGTAVGQTISEASLREVGKSIGDHIEPKVYPSVEKVMVEEKPCIRVQVEGKSAGDSQFRSALWRAYRFRHPEKDGFSAAQPRYISR